MAVTAMVPVGKMTDGDVAGVRAKKKMEKG
jgi:hypothetical protein